jgi:ATP-dependent DNA helicase RecG
VKVWKSEGPLSRPVQFVRGIGPRKAEALASVGVSTIRDLLFYAPRRYLDRSTVVTIAELRRSSGLPLTPVGNTAAPDLRRDATVVGEVKSFRVVGAGRKARFVLVLADSTGSMQCIWFGGIPYWRKAFSVGEVIAVSGPPTFYVGVLQFVHPALDRLRGPSAGDEEGIRDEVDWSKTLNTGGLVPLYPSGQELERVGLDSGGFRRIIAAVLSSHISAVHETLPDDLVLKHRLIPLQSALRAIHAPCSQEDIAAGRRRLKYEELFSFQLALALKRRARQEEPGIRFTVVSRLARRLVDALPYQLTGAQVRVIREITADMASGRPLNRLLQGDVGSGKTVVALISMLIAVDNGYQAAFMAPTEILAEQHSRTLKLLAGDLPVSVRLLMGGQKSRLRQDIREDVRNGSAQIVVGTHALFEKGVDFARLGLVVIDEQHRFGVMQRASLRKKGMNPDVLVMTATPIPRTLSLTLYGDLDVSVIDELPQGRRAVKTSVLSDAEKEEVYRFVREQVREGRQAYFVYPLIEESEKVDLKAAVEHFEHLRSRVFPELQIGLLHGRLEGGEKETVMAAFASGRTHILVATTVIEVGIDVPNASVMVIENAERFGLSQLHQLRGRVGRGAAQSFCLLLAEPWVAHRAKTGRQTEVSASDVDQRATAVQRLATMVATTDGFRIAEKDLELRGPGDFFGTRQSGLPEFRIADILTDARIMEAARQDAFALIERDPHLRQPPHAVLAEHLLATRGDLLSLLRVG